MIGINVIRTALGVVAWAVAKVPALNTRFNINSRLEGPWPEGPFLWFHGASLGECRMLLNLSKCLQEDLPNCPQILITSQKTEVVEFLQNSGAPVSVALAPVDTPQAMNRFMKTVLPIALILAENELWPGYLSSMRKLTLQPSVALVSGRFYRCLESSELSAIGFASMQTGADLTRFVAAGEFSVPAKTIIGGDWKLLPWARSGKEVELPENPKVDTAFLSMHIQEWASLQRMLLAAVKRQESVVVIPRRAEEFAAFRDQMREQDLVVVDWPLVEKGAITLVSSFGKTRDVLAVSKTAVVGGSFARMLGVHDFWEPLQMGVATCVGPFSRGQRDSVDALLREGAIARIQSPMEFNSRVIPDVNLVRNFLNHEREKVVGSYDALLNYLKKIIKSA
jgi:3-deoxy-D-manno-octulosonic-acid transferase